MLTCAARGDDREKNDGTVDHDIPLRESKGKPLYELCTRYVLLGGSKFDPWVQSEPLDTDAVCETYTYISRQFSETLK